MRSGVDRAAQDRLVQGRSKNLRQLLLRALRSINALVLHELDERGYHDIRLTHAAILAHMDLEGTTITTIAERTQNTKQATGVLVGELEERGYLRRRVYEHDARARIVTFTAKGRRLMLHTLDIIDALQERLSEELGDAALEALRRALQRLGSIDS